MPTSPKPVHVALLRGVNVGGTRKVPMATLRVLCADLGFVDAVTCLQSGNVVFRAPGSAAKLAAALSIALAERFGFAVPVVVRAGADWLRLAGKSPFPDAEQERPSLLHLALAQVAPKPSASDTLAPYCTAGERVVVRGGALWLDYRSGVARSKLTPAVLDRVVGAPVTARSWRTVQAIAALVRG